MDKIIIKKLSLSILAAFFFFDNSAIADSFRCGTSLIEVGDSKAEVVDKCGSPATTESFCRNEYLQGKFGYEAVCHNVDLWTFNRGVGTFLMKVEFEEGRAARISTGDRVD